MAQLCILCVLFHTQHAGIVESAAYERCCYFELWATCVTSYFTHTCQFSSLTTTCWYWGVSAADRFQPRLIPICFCALTWDIRVQRSHIRPGLRGDVWRVCLGWVTTSWYLCWAATGVSKPFYCPPFTTGSKQYSLCLCHCNNKAVLLLVVLWCRER